MQSKGFSRVKCNVHKLLQDVLVGVRLATRRAAVNYSHLGVYTEKQPEHFYANRKKCSRMQHLNRSLSVRACCLFCCVRVAFFPGAGGDEIESPSRGLLKALCVSAPLAAFRAVITLAARLMN
jgi:hypothetical protein